MEALIIILFFVAIFLAIFSPLIGLYVFFTIAYIRPQDFYPCLVDIEPAKWILIATFISFLFHRLLKKEQVTRAKQNWAILGIFLFILISGIKAIDNLMWMIAAEDFLRVCLVYFLFINLITTPKRLKRFFIFFILINLFVALRFYIAYKTGNAVYWGSKPGDLSYGFLQNADDLGIGLVVALPFVLIPIFYLRNIFLKWLCALISSCFMLGVLATRSKGAILGVFAVFIATIISQMKLDKLRKQRFFIGLLIVLFLFAAFIYKYRYTLQDAYETAQNQQDEGRVGRMATWVAARQMIKESPLIGVGRGNFIPYWQANYPPGVFGYQVAHNIIYEVTAEIGFFGLLFFLYFSLSGLKEIRKIAKHNKKDLEKSYFLEMLFTIYIISVIGFYLNGMFITVAFYWHIYVLVAMYVSAKTIFLKQKEVAYAKNQAKK